AYILQVGYFKDAARYIVAARHLPLAQFDHVAAAGDFFPDIVLAGKGIAALVDIAELDGVALTQGARVRRLAAGDHAEQSRLAGAVRADHANDAARRQAEVEIVDQ